MEPSDGPCGLLAAHLILKCGDSLLQLAPWLAYGCIVIYDYILHGHGYKTSRSHEGSRPATMDLVVTTRGAMIHGLVVVIQIRSTE